MPASSIARAEATISSSGSMVSCMTPIRNGWGNGLGAAVLGLLHLLVERGQDVLYLLVDDRLEHALAHRPDRPRDAHLRLPVHLRPSPVLAQFEGGVHAQHCPHAVAFDRKPCELGLPLLGLLHVHA